MEDITLSQLINLHVFNLCDLNKLQDHSKIFGDANWARKRRNEIVHQGRSGEVLRNERVMEVIESIQIMMRFIDFEISCATKDSSIAIEDYVI